MSSEMKKETKLSCREVKQRFALHLKNQSEDSSTTNEREAFKLHLSHCSRCAREYHLMSLTRTVLDLTASPEVIEPNKDFFVALQARIARGSEIPVIIRNNVEDFWSALWITARQLMPALAMILLVILGATLLWQQPASHEGSAEAQYKVRGLTTGDMLDRIVAEERIVTAEDKINDR
jgi:hypothetical protein